jgi:ammonia channel protein AmtB
MNHAHNFLRWVVLILALLTIIKSYMGMSNKKAFTAADKKMPLFFMISMDIQLLLGLALYFTGAWGLKNIQNLGMGEVMKDASSRFFAIEHTIGMVLAIVFAHVAYAFAKKQMDDTAKFKKIFIFSLLSFVVMLASIPWPFREAIARPLFPGM